MGRDSQAGGHQSPAGVVRVLPKAHQHRAQWSQKGISPFTLKKGNDKIVSLFLSPASEKGRATLRLGDNMWLYIPNVGKPVRITSLQSVVGGVFNNADIMRLDYNVEYDVQNSMIKERIRSRPEGEDRGGCL